MKALYRFLDGVGVEHELLTGVYLAMAGGVPSFAYASFSGLIKQRHGYTPKEVNLIGGFMQGGVWTAVMGGIIIDHYGPRACALASMTLGCIGYGMLYYLTESSAAERVSWGAYAVAAYATGQGCAYLYIMALKVCQSNASEAARGRIVGVLATWVSLAAGIYTILGNKFFTGTNFFLLLLCSHALQCLLGCTMRLHDVEEGLEQHPSTRAFTVIKILTALSGVTAATILLASQTGSIVLQSTTCGCAVMPLLLLVGVHVFREPRYDDDPEERVRLTASPLEDYGSSPTNAKTLEQHESAFPAKDSSDCQSEGADEDEEEEEVMSPHSPSSLSSSKFKPDYLSGAWLFVAYYFTFGPCAAALNILGGLIMSRGGMVAGVTYDKEFEKVPGEDSVVSLVTVFAVFNTAGRIITGTAVDKTRHRVHPMVWVAVWGACNSLGLLLLSVGGNNFEQNAAVAVLGLGVGGTQTVIPQLTGQVFGMKNFAKALGCMAFAPSSGSLSFGALYAWLEESQEDISAAYIIDNNESLPVKYCVGQDCLESGLQVGSCSALFGAILAALLFWRTHTRQRAKTLPPVVDVSDDARDAASAGEADATSARSPRVINCSGSVDSEGIAT